MQTSQLEETLISVKIDLQLITNIFQFEEYLKLTLEQRYFRRVKLKNVVLPVILPETGKHLLLTFFFHVLPSYSTGARQNFARKYTIPIDHVGFQFQMMKEEKHMEDKPDDGVYVYVSVFHKI